MSILKGFSPVEILSMSPKNIDTIVQKWSSKGLLDSIEDNYTRRITALLLENQEKYKEVAQEKTERIQRLEAAKRQILGEE